MAYLFFALTCLLFGSNFKLMDDAAQVLGPSSVALGRLWGGAAVLLPVVWMRRQSLQVSRETLVRILFVAIMGNAYPFAIQPWILAQGADHSFLAVFVPMTPLLTIAAAIPMLGVRPTWQQTVGVLGGFALLLWIVFRDPAEHNFAAWLVPFAITVPLSYAIGNVYLRRNLRNESSLVVSTWLLMLAGLLLVPLAAFEIITQPPHASVDAWTKVVLAMLVLGPLGTGLCIYMFVEMVRERGPLFAGMVTYVVPPIAFAWGYLDGETISVAQMVGIAGILAMVALVQSSQANYAT